jgi:hypothetical protein
MRGLPPLAIGLILVSFGLGACGDGDDGEDAGGDSGGQPAETRDLNRFLMRQGEEPGFRPAGRARTVTGVNAIVKVNHLPPADAERLRGQEFISFAFQPTRGPRTFGTTSVHLFAASEGAESYVAHEQSKDVLSRVVPGAKIGRFGVAGIPGARGWTASRPHLGHVLWVQGRCALILGNEGPGPFPGPLSTAARAIYERTNGECP